MSVKKYFMVHRQKGNSNNPSVSHSTKHDAEIEAQRLAKLNPGTTYVVLEAVSAFCTMENPVVLVEIVGGPSA